MTTAKTGLAAALSNQRRGTRMRFAKSRRAAAGAVVVCVGLLSASSTALARDGHLNPPAAGATSTTRLPPTPDAKTVKAVVVKSWGSCDSSGTIWDQLNADWSLYGAVPIHINDSNPALCGGSFTLAALESSGADVVILSDPAGGHQGFTQRQVDALSAYVREGHTLIGTFLVFAYEHDDNSALAPLFGLAQDAGWVLHQREVDTTYALRVNKHRGPAKELVRGLPVDYASDGYRQTQVPGDGKWSRNDLRGARIIARNAGETAAISVYSRAGYNAIYIANMPEYGGGVQDEQFMYNAIIFPRKG